MTSIVVSIRVRPFNSREKKFKSVNIVDMPNDNVTELRVVKQGKLLTNEQPRKFNMDHCFWSHDGFESDKFATQEKVYLALGKSTLDNAMIGFNACLFAYGQTGSGKTYSMMGQPSDPGVIPRLAKDLFARSDEIQKIGGPDVEGGGHVTVQCSYLEIYNEVVKDLLNPSNVDKPMKVRQHPKLGVFVEGLTKMTCRQESEIDRLIDDGAKIRTVASTNMNANSSRSHAILTLNVRVKKSDGETSSQLHLVDLAGSERAASTGAEGDTLKEGANINRSLTTLGMCLSRLAEVADGKKGGHVPFRDSQLTWLLCDSLGGNSRTAMLANISPADINYEETLSTLRFAATTKKIKNHAVVNEDPQQKIIRELREEIQQLRDELKRLDEGGSPRMMSRGTDEEEEGTATSSSNDIIERIQEDMEIMERIDDELTASPEEQLKRAESAFIQHEENMKNMMKERQPTTAQFGQGETMEMITSRRAMHESHLPRVSILNENLHQLPAEVTRKISLFSYIQPMSVHQIESHVEDSLGSSAAATTLDNVMGSHPSSWIPLPNVPAVCAFFAFDEESQEVTLHVANAKNLSSTETPRTEEEEDAHQHQQENPSSQGGYDDIFVNGDLMLAGSSRVMNSWDRIAIGDVLFFRLEIPDVCRRHGEEEDGDDCIDFETEPLCEDHLYQLETHHRLSIELEAAEGFSAICNEWTQSENDEEDRVLPPHELPFSDEELDDMERAVLHEYAEAETKLSQDYPKEDPAIAAANNALKYDFTFAKRELNRKQKDYLLFKKSGVTKDATDIARLAAEEREKEEELERLKKELEEAKAIKAQQHQERQQQQQQDDQGQSLASTSASASATYVPLSPRRTGGGAHVDPNLPGVDHRQGQERTVAEEKLAVALELQAHEEMCAKVEQWKDAPVDLEDKREYQFCLEKPTLKAVKDRGGLLWEGKLYKLRVKTGLFSRSGFHQCYAVIRPKFLLYFESTDLTKKALGSVYLYGCQVTPFVQDKKPSLRLAPCVPRKPGQARATSVENQLVIAFDKQLEADTMRKLLESLRLPPPATDRLAKYLAEEARREEEQQQAQ